MNWTHRIRLRHLEILVRLCEAGNLSQVAAELNITQPALSKWLKDLEQDIGLPLFERQARGIAPTAHALALQEHARAIIGKLDRAHHAMAQLASGATGTLEIGCSPTVAPVLLPASIQRFRAAYPGVMIHVVENSLNHLAPHLLQGRHDVLVGRLEQQTFPDGLRCEALYEDPICLAVGCTHPLAGMRRVTWKAVLAFPWMSPDASAPLRIRLDYELALAGQPAPRQVIASSSVQTNVALLAGSDLVMPVSRGLAEHFEQQGLLRILPLAMQSRGAIGMVWRDGEAESEHAAYFMQCLRLAC
ncbi:LysR substrate-binding domain-containing protein [Bordetella petrii]|uniref:LysR substrate-binding domain-containing protein n=1 Tax=Bordetella petrii TaxID=94624 RepID=UPI001A97D1AE|nr:LysR substrate-binding domain-containing protein [Bordetella petrii]MBO1111892.1 LysR family transcriptional regulator [Bordetella petrii]